MADPGQAPSADPLLLAEDTDRPPAAGRQRGVCFFVSADLTAAAPAAGTARPPYRRHRDHRAESEQAQGAGQCHDGVGPVRGDDVVLGAYHHPTAAHAGRTDRGRDVEFQRGGAFPTRHDDPAGFIVTCHVRIHGPALHLCGGTGRCQRKGDRDFLPHLQRDLLGQADRSGDRPDGKGDLCLDLADGQPDDAPPCLAGTEASAAQRDGQTGRFHTPCRLLQILRVLGHPMGVHTELLPGHDVLLGQGQRDGLHPVDFADADALFRQQHFRVCIAVGVKLHLHRTLPGGVVRSAAGLQQPARRGAQFQLEPGRIPPQAVRAVHRSQLHLVRERYRRHGQRAGQDAPHGLFFKGIKLSGMQRLTGQCGLQTGERRADDKALRPERCKGREVFCAARKEGHCGPADLQQSGTVRSISGGRIHAVEHISRLDNDSVDVEVLQLVQVTLGGVF